MNRIMMTMQDYIVVFIWLGGRRFVAFLHLVISSSGSIVSKQQSLLFIFTVSKLVTVDWLRLPSGMHFPTKIEVVKDA